MRKFCFCFLFLLIFSVYAEKEKLPVVSNAEELKIVKDKKIIWQKDQAVMVDIPASDTTKSFWMDTTEVTVGQFKKFLAESDHKFDRDSWGIIDKYSPTDKHPMIGVSWHDATAYTKWAEKRLPTEKEWEFATRGGLADKKYSWGDNERLARDYANYLGTGGKDKWNHASPVGSLQPNGYGLYDVAGNAYEWCQDWYAGYREYKVLRGGSWNFSTVNLIVSDVVSDLPTGKQPFFGFRCVADVK